jgi:hypothetical protein
MDIVVGETVYENCYFDIPRADQIIKSEFVSGDEIRVYWDSLQDKNEDKAVLIKRGTRQIDGCLFRGKKVDPSNKLQFPRYIDGVLVELPYELEIAVLEQAIREAVNSNKEEIILQELGVKSYGTEGSTTSFSNSGSKNVRLSNGIYEDIYYKYIQKWTI